MSSSMTILHGNLGKDPELFRTGSNFPIASFSIATKRRRKDEGGNYVDVTDWHNCKALGKTAELVERYLKKGSEVVVYGHNETREYDDKNGGAKRYSTEVIVDNLDFCGSASGSGQNQNNSGGGQNYNQGGQQNRGNQGQQNSGNQQRSQNSGGQNQGQSGGFNQGQGNYNPDDEIPY